MIVFGGPITLGALATAEQVRPPTISKLVATLEAAGLVERETDAQDRRITRVRATARGTRLLHDGRLRRVATLAASLAASAGGRARDPDPGGAGAGEGGPRNLIGRSLAALG